MAKKWTNERIDEAVSGRSIRRVTDLCGVAQPSVTKIQWMCTQCETEWSATGDSVLRGSGCPNCAGNSPYTHTSLQDQLTRDARPITVLELHVGTQQYQRRVSLQCQICDHAWKPLVLNVMNKRQGCPRCGKSGRYSQKWFTRHPHNVDTPGTLYVVRLFGHGEDFIKVGMTKHNTTHRFSGISTPYNVEVLAQYHTTLYAAWCIEQDLLLHHKSDRYTPTLSFGGNTECLTPAALSSVLKRLNDSISNSHASV